MEPCVGSYVSTGRGDRFVWRILLGELISAAVCMKKPRLIRTASTLLAVMLTLLGSVGRAQVAGSAPGGMNAALMQSVRPDDRLFGQGGCGCGGFLAAGAAADADGLCRSRRQDPARYRCSQIRSKQVTPEILSAMNRAGIGKMSTIIRPDKKASYIVYPGVRNYSIVPMTKAESDAVGKDLSTTRTELGRETIDGHACVKHRVTVKNQQAVILEATTWNATDRRISDRDRNDGEGLTSRRCGSSKFSLPGRTAGSSRRRPDTSWRAESQSCASPT